MNRYSGWILIGLLTVPQLGRTAPFTWSLTRGSPGLPRGLDINSSNSLINGTPAQQGAFDFSIRLLDSAARYSDRPYSLSITP
jgi:hypothetical protein